VNNSLGWYGDTEATPPCVWAHSCSVLTAHGSPRQHRHSKFPAVLFHPVPTAMWHLYAAQDLLRITPMGAILTSMTAQERLSFQFIPIRLCHREMMECSGAIDA